MKDDGRDGVMEEFKIATGQRTEMVDITGRVQELVDGSGARDGLCVVFVPHTTAAVTINEGADPAVRADILAELGKVIPFDDGYTHMEGNSAGHIKTSLTGSSATVSAMLRSVFSPRAVRLSLTSVK